MTFGKVTLTRGRIGPQVRFSRRECRSLRSRPAGRRVNAVGRRPTPTICSATCSATARPAYSRNSSSSKTWPVAAVQASLEPSSSSRGPQRRRTSTPLTKASASPGVGPPPGSTGRPARVPTVIAALESGKPQHDARSGGSARQGQQPRVSAGLSTAPHVSGAARAADRPNSAGDPGRTGTQASPCPSEALFVLTWGSPAAQRRW